MSLQHVVYGLRLETNVALPGLPLASARNAVDVRIRVKDKWTCLPESFVSTGEVLYISSQVSERGEPLLQVGMLEGGAYFGFFCADGTRFAVERAGREIWADWAPDCTIEDSATYLLGPILAFVLWLKGLVSLHASAIVLDDRAIAFVGPGGAGKSTTAAAFAKHGFEVLSDDVVVLDVQGDDFLVRPAYPRVSLWPDSAQVLFGPGDVLSRLAPSWDKRYLPLDGEHHKFASRPIRLGAIYFLGTREKDLASPVIEPFSGNRALLALFAETYVNYLLTADMQRRCFDVLGRIIDRVPVHNVQLASDPATAVDLCKVVTAHARQLCSLQSP